MFLKFWRKQQNVYHLNSRLGSLCFPPTLRFTASILYECDEQYILTKNLAISSQFPVQPTILNGANAIFTHPQVINKSMGGI